MTVDRLDPQVQPAGERHAPDPLVFVTVGTDHHPFERVVHWADAWAYEHPEVHVVIQYGTAAPPLCATGHESLPYQEMQRLMADADVVVTQGGPGGIIDCRSAGKLPIVVPRTAALGEHIDDHQVAFATHMYSHRRIELATDQVTFGTLVAKALANPWDFTADEEEHPTARTAATIDEVLGRLQRHRRRRFWQR